MNKIETAFLVYKDESGAFTAVTDIEVDADQDRQATRQDVKLACISLLETINQQDIAQIVTEAIKSLTPALETPASSIREALADRGIL
jgi:hypothetical protein